MGKHFGHRRFRHRIIGSEWTTTIQVGSWAAAPEESVLLHSVVKHLLFRHKGRVQTSGVRDVSLSESGFEPDPQLHPRTGYVPLVRCTLHWQWRQTRRKPSPTFFTLQPATFTNDEL